ncbi:hypothetical protein GOBAR_AA25418 [Gossypium barbadense]|uniref:Uncharacterized protein n=1 Tax=Gossypium barbadense TaxID=3634 RepID=A0A2P5WVX7_GOSBA|nr:hypothetical protein GOBAR_AA25418 [Gossypium barbadense]
MIPAPSSASPRAATQGRDYDLGRHLRSLCSHSGCCLSPLFWHTSMGEPLDYVNGVSVTNIRSSPSRFSGVKFLYTTTVSIHLRASFLERFELSSLARTRLILRSQKPAESAIYRAPLSFVISCFCNTKRKLLPRAYIPYEMLINSSRGSPPTSVGHVSGIRYFTHRPAPRGSGPITLLRTRALLVEEPDAVVRALLLSARVFVYDHCNEESTHN